MSQPSPKRSEYDEATERELARWPGVTSRREMTGRHNRLVLCFGGKSRFVVYPASGSDHRGALNHVSDVRAALRDLGASRLPERRATSPKHQRNRTEPSRIKLGEKPVKDPTRDPWQALAQIQFPAPVEPPPVPAPTARRPLWQRIASLFRHPPTTKD